MAYLKQLVAYWRDTFDWRDQERRLNRFEQFKTNIDGLDVHFIHRRAKQPKCAAASDDVRAFFRVLR